MPDLFNLKVFKDDLIMELSKKCTAISTAPFGGGVIEAKHIVFHRVPENFDKEPNKVACDIIRKFHLDPSSTIVFLTAMDVASEYVKVEGSVGDLKIGVVATVGLRNPVTLGYGKYHKAPSTINIAAVINNKLSPNALVEAIKTIVEAKVEAIRCVDLRCGDRVAIGTSTDALAIATLGEGRALKYSGQLTEIGKLLSKLTFKAIMKSCESSGYSPSRDLLKRLSERGIDMETLVEASLKLFIPWKGMNREKARKTIRKYLKLLSRDPNISSLVMASARLDEDARIGLIPGLSKEDYLKDPVYLVADEILGMALALYINGWNGLFEYYRYDREKPGVIKRLPPFMDDVIAAFIAGVTSRIYSKGLEERP